jgi:nitrogen fixation protein NifU and related proteins
MSDELYQALILEHARRPHAMPAGAERRAELDNPFCGDTVTVAVRLDAGRLAEVGWEGEGCALMKASASMMTEAARGLDAAGVAELRARLAAVLAGGAGEGDLAAFSGVAANPSRRRCVTLPWEALATLV